MDQPSLSLGLLTLLYYAAPQIFRPTCCHDHCGHFLAQGTRLRSGDVQLDSFDTIAVFQSRSLSRFFAGVRDDPPDCRSWPRRISLCAFNTFATCLPVLCCDSVPLTYCCCELAPRASNPCVEHRPLWCSSILTCDAPRASRGYTIVQVPLMTIARE